jgi:hypothetical protein
MRQAPLRLLPTASLIEEAAMARGASSTDAWNVLMMRTLSPAQEQKLVDRLLDGRQRHRFLHAGPDGWLKGRQAAGLLSAQDAERYADDPLRRRTSPSSP